MKNENRITLIIFAVVTVAVIVVMIIHPFKGEEETQESESVSVSETTEPETETTELTTEETTEETTKLSKADYTMSDALFIGDSRTVGIMEYGGIDDADFFCNVGMSIYNIGDDTETVGSLENVTIEQLLSQKQYGKVFLMMGVNEVGYNLDTTIEKYEAFIAMIKEKQPDAVIIIQANLHVTKSRSDKDKVVNNKAINNFNAQLEKMADNETIFYIDANEIFDDSNGALASDKTGDSTHILAKYYEEWGNWIVDKSAEVLGYE